MHRPIARSRTRVVCRSLLVFMLVGWVAEQSRAMEEPQARPSGTIDGHPALERAPRHTTTARGHQGDAVNVAFIGTEEELHRTLAAAGWYAADPITLATSVRIAADVVLRKPYDHAPVSDLYLWGRTQDAASNSRSARAPSNGITSASGAPRNGMTGASRSGWGRPPTTNGWRSAARPGA
jgi:hypothetical protein